jgi:hypothetical protein
MTGNWRAALAATMTTAVLWPVVSDNSLVELAKPSIARRKGRTSRPAANS